MSKNDKTVQLIVAPGYFCCPDCGTALVAETPGVAEMGDHLRTGVIEMVCYPHGRYRVTLPRVKAERLPLQRTKDAPA